MADRDETLRRTAPKEADRIDPCTCEGMMLAYYDFVYNLANAFLLDADEADDAAQETFLQATLHIAQFERGTNLKRWIAKIAINVCRGRYRKHMARRRLETVLKNLASTLHASTPSPEDHTISGERHHLLQQAVDALEEKHRLPILLRYVHDLTVPEIAQILDEKEGTIHSRLHYAHRKLRSRLGSGFDSEWESKPGGGTQ
jgi:RNA polymerase sigma-70 factor (ECF subfamily)